MNADLRVIIVQRIRVDKDNTKLCYSHHASSLPYSVELSNQISVCFLTYGKNAVELRGGLTLPLWLSVQTGMVESLPPSPYLSLSLPPSEIPTIRLLIHTLSLSPSPSLLICPKFPTLRKPSPQSLDSHSILTTRCISISFDSLVTVSPEITSSFRE